MGPLYRELERMELSGLVLLAQAEPEREYIFRHALIQEAAYDSMLLSQWRHLHHIVGMVLEKLCPDRLEEHYGLLAHHHNQAQVWDKACRYLILAGDQSRGRYAN